MGVLAEITKRVLGTTEWAFGVYHPFGAEQRAEPGGERLRILKRRECSMEAEFALPMKLSQPFCELAPEDFFEDIDRQEELLL